MAGTVPVSVLVPAPVPVPRRGLDSHGFIEREGSLGRVPPAFRPVVAATRDRVLDLFGARLDSAYLCGSIPRGTARVGRSDLDLLAALREEPGAMPIAPATSARIRGSPSLAAIAASVTPSSSRTTTADR